MALEHNEPTHAQRLHGRVARGQGLGGFFMAVPWVRQQVRDKLGFDPYPGTFNLLLEPESLAAWEALLAAPGLAIPPAEEGYCSARCYPVVVAGQVPAAVMYPEVDGYPANKAELIAPVRLSEALGLAEGDVVTFAAQPAGPARPALKFHHKDLG